MIQWRKSCLSYEKETGSNVINVLMGGSEGLCTGNLNLVITDESKKISKVQELTMQLSQTLSSAIAQIKVSNSPITNHTKKVLPQRPPPFFNFCIT